VEASRWLAGSSPVATMGTMKPKVVVAEEIAEAGLKALEEHANVEMAIGLERYELLGRLADAAGLIVRSGTAVDAD